MGPICLVTAIANLWKHVEGMKWCQAMVTMVQHHESNKAAKQTKMVHKK